MKKHIISKLAISLTILFLLASCEDESVIDQPEDKVSGIDMELLASFLKLKSDMTISNGGQQTQVSQANGRMESAARTTEDGEPSDPWETCAEVTETEEDGVYTLIMDYGDGCYEGDEIFQIFYFGKYTSVYTYDYTDSVNIGDFSGKTSGKTTYENFGSKYEFEDSTDEYITNGASTYQAVFEDSFDHETGIFETKFDSDYQDDLFIKEIFEGQEFNVRLISDVTENYEYTAELDDFSDIHTITKADYSYTLNDTLTYTSKVIAPLVMTSECSDNDEFVFTYISGVEEVSSNGVTLTINYGDGECDNIIVVTDEDGNSEEIDLSDEFGDYEEELDEG